MKEKLLERHKTLTENIDKAKADLQQSVANLNVLEGARQEVEFLLNSNPPIVEVIQTEPIAL